MTNWYRKPTFSGRYVNYFSSHPHNYKIRVITSLVDRAILLSDKRFHHSNIKIVREILINNCFPIHIINRLIKKRLKELRHNTDTLLTNVSTKDSDDDTHIIILRFLTLKV